jgi:hypothetical protein
MRAKGITYDTGFFHLGASTREPFDPDVVRRELEIIRDDLHCTAVRVTGGDPDRLEVAATHAAALGLEVWLSPFTCDLTRDQLLELLVDCAERAERLRQRGAEVVFVTGAELSLFTVGFLPGEILAQRFEFLSQPQRLREHIAAIPPAMNEFLGRAVAAVRQRFAGKVSYASILPLEGVDWTPFDIISVDAYRSKQVADQFADGIRTLVAQGKPVAITESGCTTHRGAADKGARGGMIVEYDGPTPTSLDGEYVRDEAEQAAYLRELLDIFDTAGVDTAFVVTFASYYLPHRDNPVDDLDMSSFGVVKVYEDRFGETYPDLKWEPKAAFHALAAWEPTAMPKSNAVH